VLFCPRIFIKNARYAITTPCPPLVGHNRGKSTNEEEKYFTELINGVKSIFKENLTELEVKCILDTAKGDINIIKDKYVQAQNVTKITSIVGWILTDFKETTKPLKKRINLVSLISLSKEYMA
jgi:hypothetical protein